MKTVEFQLKRLLKVSPFTLAFALFPFASLAVDVQDVPNPRQVNGTWVTDMAQMLDEPTEAQLNSIIAQLERKNGTEIAVVTVPETAPAASPKAFTTKLFNYWGIGKKGKDNGVLFLISQNERRVEIETGYGIAAILPNAKVGKIIDTQILPRFKQSDFNGGTLAGTKSLVIALEAHQPATSASQTFLPTQSSTLAQEVSQDDDFPWLPLAGGGVIIGGGLILAIAKRCCVRVASRREAQIAAANYVRRRQRRSCIKPPVSTSTVSSRHVEVDVDVDVDVSDSNDDDCNDWSYQLDSSDDSTSSSFGGGSSGGDGAGSSYESNWNSDSSSCSNDESSSSSWNSDSSSCSNDESSSSSWNSDSSSCSNDESSSSSWSSDSSSCSYESSSSSSDFGGGSSGGDGAGSDW